MVNLAHAMWVHGHSMQIEHEERLASALRTGYGITIDGKPGTDNWFHFAVPTPVIVDDSRLRVGSVMLVFKTMSADAVVRHVHVYDGANKIAEHNDIDLHGDAGFVRFEIPSSGGAEFGIGISIGVSFGVESMPHSMEFVAAGCDFLP
jgi:hypothetical protein